MSSEEVSGLKIVCGRLARDAYQRDVNDAASSLQPIYISPDVCVPLPDGHPLGVSHKLLLSDKQKSSDGIALKKEEMKQITFGQKEQLAHTRSLSKRYGITRKSPSSKQIRPASGQQLIYEEEPSVSLFDELGINKPVNPPPDTLLNTLKEFREKKRAWLLARASVRLVDLSEKDKHTRTHTHTHTQTT
eukprot:GHVR01148345.1.p1 GENE.GHVR01148345.1~~GHVR01148345.1.p1  ORF type:complete len:189 (+),score=83.60 GHVR01148345.1:214-780(+)